MKMKSAPIALIAVVIATAIMIAPIHAAPSPAIYARTDKASYLPGDSGTLYVTIRNEGSSSFGIRNITLTYPWFKFITDHWDGNVTYTYTGVALSQAGTWNQQYSFTVPTDGRATPSLFGGTVSVRLGTDIGPEGSYDYSSASIAIAIAAYQPLGIATSILPVVTIVLLAVAVVMLALLYMTMRKQAKK